jgi:hypothetical protein
MNQAMTGRAVAAVGVVLGVIAIFVDFTSTALGSSGERRAPRCPSRRRL